MNVKKIILLVAASVALNANAQSKKALKDAQLTYASENFCDAAAKCAVAYSKITKNTPKALSLKAEYAFRTGESFRRIDDAAQAVTWFEKAILLKYQEKDPIVYLYTADMYRVLAEFAKAEANYKLYQQKVPDDSRAEIGIKSCQMNQEFKANRTRHTITNVSALNTDGFDMAPMFIDKKDIQLAFTSTSEKYGITGGKTEDPIACVGYSDIFVAEIDKKGQFTKVIPIVGDSINTEDNEGTICIDGRAKTMFFTRCPNVKKENMGCEIWMSEAGSNKWEKPTKLSLKSNDTISIGHPCVSEDGKFLIFASDDPSGLGGRDLWYTEYDKRAGTWSAPKNMGPEINTASDELFPTFAKNGDLIYSSNGLPGMGGLDLYRAAKVGTENKWENPTNYGSPINSDFNDYAMIEVNERKGYFTSERKGVVGDNLRPDIFMYEMPPNIFSLCVNVFDLSDKKRQTKIAGVKVVVQGNVAADRWEGLTTAEGTICWDKKPNGDRYINENSSYSITVSKEKFYENKTPAQFTTVGLDFNQDFVIDMGLLPIKPIRLPEVRYPLAQWTFVNDSSCMSLDSLNYVITLLDEFPGLILELSSHTDPRGGNIYNQVLSENRAKACYVYLVNEKGVDPRRIVPVGKGEMEPRRMYLLDGKYLESQPLDPVTKEPIAAATEVRMTEAYMAPFKKTDKKKFEQLQQYNRRTEGKVVTLDFDPSTTKPANPDFMVFKKLPPSNK